MNATRQGEIWIAGRLMYSGPLDPETLTHYQRCYPANNLQISYSRPSPEAAKESK